MPPLHDISPRIGPDFPVWPGDVAPRQAWTCRRDAGDSTNTSALTASVHLGAHADAPLHFLPGGADAASLDLAPYLGPARVVDLAAVLAHRPAPRLITTADLAPFLAAADAPPRFLVRTATWRPTPPFAEDFASFAPEAIDALARRGVVLVGIDTPSVDPCDSRDLPSHLRLGAHGVRNLECLCLEGVAAGDYELIALPLALAGFDASPVRAVLRSPAR